jgi:acetyl esterase/lipase
LPRKNNKLNRRSFHRTIGLGVAGLALACSPALKAVCLTGDSIEDAAYPEVSLEQDDPMPVSFSDVLLLPAGQPDVVSSYGATAQQFGELWLPTTKKAAPLVVLIHGGCWQSEYDIEHVRPAATALRKAGYIVWAIEYRRIGDPGGGWPGTFEDVALAIDHLDWLLQAEGVNTRSRVYMGHSAGGQLALWAAARSNFPAGHPFYSPDAKTPDAVFGLAAITDMRTYAAGESSCEQSAVDLLGSPAEQPGRYAAVSPMDLLPLGAPSVLAQGTEDPIVPPAQAETFQSRAVEVGEGSKLLRLPGAGHFDLIHPRTDAWRAILAELEECS